MKKMTTKAERRAKKRNRQFDGWYYTVDIEDQTKEAILVNVHIRPWFMFLIRGLYWLPVTRPLVLWWLKDSMPTEPDAT
jgi:hypothetical protein